MIRDPIRLVDDLSQAVSDGEAVDWGHATDEVHDPETRLLLEQLRVVEDIARLHRDTLPDPADAHLPTLDVLAQAASGTWGRLSLLRVIGRGARGMVYRANDPQLDRDVALKLIAEDSGVALADEVINEARQMARVNHPNVATIHGAERADGLAGLWMELIEGETLESLLRDGNVFSAREAALIGVDVCAALAAVHKAGLLHRDVKTQNVMRDRTGRIVLTDFGTSRTQWQDVGALNYDEVGTPLYMAPEVLQGGSASARSDIYSVGVLLFRLVTGSVPVEGASLEALKQAHRSGIARRLSDERSDLPLAFMHIVERALAPNPADRYPSAGALEMALATFLAPAPETLQVAGRSPLRGPAAVAAGLLLGALGAMYWMGPAEPPPAELRFPLYPQPTHEVESMAISPDGRSIAFTSAGQLWVRRFDRVDPVPFPNTQGARDPFWSPDGQSIAYFRSVSVWRVPAEGGEPQVVAPARRPSSGSWGRDGFLLYSTDLGRTLVRVAASGGDPVVLREQVPGSRVNLWWPVSIGSGRSFVYSAMNPGTGRRALYLASTSGDPGEDRVLLDTASNVEVAGGHLYFVRLGQLMAQPFDERNGTLVGSPVVVADYVRTNPYNFNQADVSVSAAGPVAFVGGVQSSRQLQLVGEDGRTLADLGPAGEYRDIALSHDGTRLAFEEIDPETGTRDIWIHDIDRGARVRLTQHPADETSPVWARDDRTVYFLSNRDQGLALYRRSVERPGSEEPVLTFDMPVRPSAVDTADTGLFYEQLDQANGWDLWWRPLDGGPPRPFLQTEFNDHEPQPSPDGQLVAYSSPDSGGRQVYLALRGNSDRRWRVSTTYGREPLWRADGRELFYHGLERQLMAVSVEMRDGEPVLGRPRALFELRFRGYDLRYHYAALPDGKRFVLNAPLPGSMALPATIIVNPPWVR